LTGLSSLWDRLYLVKGKLMTTDRYIRMAAGVFVLVSPHFSQGFAAFGRKAL